MSSQDNPSTEELQFEKDVVRYLRDNPDFFESHLDLLADMILPHKTGTAVSLIERQVSVLRDQKEEHKKKFQQLILNAQQNEKLNANINTLILELLDAESLDNVIDILEQRIRSDFEADAIAVKLLTSGNVALKAHQDLTSWQQPALLVGEKVMTGREPVCGKFKPDQMQALFNDADIQSAGIVPLAKEKNSKHCYGIIAIGSYDPHRFRPDMGTLFLSLLGKVLTRILVRHLEE